MIQVKCLAVGSLGATACVPETEANEDYHSLRKSWQTRGT